MRAVARAFGMREATASVGVGELAAGVLPTGRVRRAGAGRKALAQADPGLVRDLMALIEPQERGDPVSPLRWTTKSLRNLAAALRDQGHQVSYSAVVTLLREAGFSLQGNAKVLEGGAHSDRDAQFRYINDRVREYLDSGPDD